MFFNPVETGLQKWTHCALAILCCAIRNEELQLAVKLFPKNKISRSYQHLTALSLEKHLETIRYSPGLEEYALQYAFETMLKKYKKCNYRLFDMPPTALALKFFNLPKLSLVWIDQLMELRKKILEKKKIIEEVHQRKIEGAEDKVLAQLGVLKNVYQGLIKSFSNTQTTGIYIVVNEDQLSLSESADIYDKISNSGFNIEGILLNKYQNHITEKEFAQKFSNIQHHLFPNSGIPLFGLQNLITFNTNQTFQSYINQLVDSDEDR